MIGRVPGPRTSESEKRLGARATTIRTILPIAIGFVAAVSLIAAGHAASRYFARHPPTRSQRSAFFAAWSALWAGCSILVWAVGEGTPAQRGMALSGAAVISAVAAWAAVGTACEWRGFREENGGLDDGDSPEEHRLWDSELDPPSER